MDFIFVLCYYIVINAAAFAFFAYDKRQAQRRGRRVSEKTLLGLCFFGGFIGGYAAMRFYRHKTRHKYFYAVLLIALALHALLIAYFLFF